MSEIQKPKVFIGSFIPVEIRDELKTFAAAEKRTFSDYVRLALEAHVARRRPKKPTEKKRRTA